MTDRAAAIEEIKAQVDDLQRAVERKQAAEQREQDIAEIKVLLAQILRLQGYTTQTDSDGRYDSDVWDLLGD